MADKEFEFIPGTDDTPPQIRNEDWGTPEQVAAAHAAVDAWYLERQE